MTNITGNSSGENPEGGFQMGSGILKRNEQALLTLRETLDKKAGSYVVSPNISLGHLVVGCKTENWSSFAALLKNDQELRFNMLVDVTVVDWMDSRDIRFEVVYHFLSTTTWARLRVKIEVDEDAASVPSICSLWDAANFLEREAWDMYGIDFRGHPDQRRILMYDEFVGHPLRKDYPLQGKQPRIPLRAPEVRNTAVDMQRPTLVHIGKKR